jgi:hypothetical protein
MTSAANDHMVTASASHSWTSTRRLSAEIAETGDHGPWWEWHAKPPQPDQARGEVGQNLFHEATL